MIKPIANPVMKDTSPIYASVDEEETRQLAYQLWQRADCPPGRSIEFWTAAEKLLLDGHSARQALQKAQPSATKSVKSAPKRPVAKHLAASYQRAAAS